MSATRQMLEGLVKSGSAEDKILKQVEEKLTEIDSSFKEILVFVGRIKLPRDFTASADEFEASLDKLRAVVKEIRE